ncbi:MAG: RNA polymerase sigma factor [Oscillospiraceae bacterium]|nr:RNA polymerase sigma factor [Oscillospiraceae bacterium]
MVKGVRKRMYQYQLTEQTNQDDLIAAVAEGSADAMARLYKQAGTSVYAFALSVLKNSQDAEDVLHDCFISIHAAAGSYRAKGKPMAWILTIAKNLCLKRLREQSRTVQLNPEDWKDYVDGNPAVTADDKVVIRACMEQLSDEERQIVVLHAVSGFKHREIASLLNLALPTVLSKYNRAIKKLKAYF